MTIYILKLWSQQLNTQLWKECILFIIKRELQLLLLFLILEQDQFLQLQAILQSLQKGQGHNLSQSQNHILVWKVNTNSNFQIKDSKSSMGLLFSKDAIHIVFLALLRIKIYTLGNPSQQTINVVVLITC